jgi:hypothetical protein
VSFYFDARVHYHPHRFSSWNFCSGLFHPYHQPSRRHSHSLPWGHQDSPRSSQGSHTHRNPSDLPPSSKQNQNENDTLPLTYRQPKTQKNKIKN